jgi:hypothetical protein
VPTMLLFVFPFLKLLINSTHTHVSCHGFFHVRYKEFGNLLITDSTQWQQYRKIFILKCKTSQHSKLHMFGCIPSRDSSRTYNSGPLTENPSPLRYITRPFINGQGPERGIWAPESGKTLGRV